MIEKLSSEQLDKIFKRSVYKNGKLSGKWESNCSDCGKIIYIYCMTKHTGKCNKCAIRGKPYQAVYTKLIWTAKTKNIPNSITYEQFFELCKVENCHYCGEKVQRLKYGITDSKTCKELSNMYSLDRINSNKGYSVDNVVTCCKICNLTKRNCLTHIEMYLLMKLKIYKLGK